ncbi:hypothetical protein J4204_02900 [Candidatus Woesearchaeota archaeon]|nr:hypothetical protein [Candidatus Woesearchaeota archaeon]
MDWKEFLKPSKWKILITVVLFVLGFWLFFGYSPKVEIPSCVSPSFCGPLYLYPLFLILNWPLFIVISGGSSSPVAGTIFAPLIMIIIPLLYDYVLSCCGILIVKKLKNKSKN